MSVHITNPLFSKSKVLLNQTIKTSIEKYSGDPNNGPWNNWNIQIAD